MLELKYFPDGILLEKCEDVSLPTMDEAVKAYEIMSKNNGIGIAAPQIGSRKRFFFCNNCFIVNPVITAFEGELCHTIEGCLSLPKKSYVVPRHSIIKTETLILNQHGLYSKREFTLTGIDAIVFQHEYDHLDGILINERGVNVDMLSDQDKKALLSMYIEMSVERFRELKSTNSYIKNGLTVFTEEFHRLRGKCCNSDCKHCPYKATK